ncbi:hypothetical protein PR048_022461 [Dryococelus australis]|uniref:Uncharacterized protein n=1 Tax=Dryococelus australis TaxID=614101 RepID=A0ABQ9H131_9NEOP|nr:hypothetical protein PR048_022461 [Dryococelus australis]
MTKMGLRKRSRRTYTKQYYLPKGVSRVKLESSLQINVCQVLVWPQKMPEADMLIIHRFLDHTHTKVYLNPDFSITKMFSLYQDYCKEQSVLPRNEELYRKRFVEALNLSFKKPKNDTCGKCDRHELVLKSSKDVVELEQIHLELAESSYEEKRRDKLHSKGNYDSITMSFDLHKCLPTPLLMSGSAICRVHLMRLLVNIYSDSCPGQYLNIFVAVMLLNHMQTLHIQDRTLVINYKFLEPGHTHIGGYHACCN